MCRCARRSARSIQGKHSVSRSPGGRAVRGRWAMSGKKLGVVLVIGAAALLPLRIQAEEYQGAAAVLKQIAAPPQAGGADPAAALQRDLEGFQEDGSKLPPAEAAA